MAKFKYAEGLHLVHWYPEAASQSFKKGQPVYLSSGKLTACGNDEVQILGIALADASGTTDTSIPVLLATPLTIFEATATSAGSDVQIAVTHVGKHYALYVSSNDVYVDLGDTDHDALKVVDLVDDAGTTNGKVLVKVLAAASQFDAKEAA